MPQTYLVVPKVGKDDGYLSNYDDAGQPYGTPLYQLPGRLQGWKIGQGAIYDPKSPLRGYQLGPDGTNFITVSENGSVDIQVGTSMGAINQGTSLTTEYGIAGTVDIQTDDGPYSLNITFAKLSRTGKRWAEYTNSDTGETSNHMVAANRSLADLNADNPGWTRWLTADEVIAQSLTGELFRLAQSQDPLERDRFEELLDAMGLTREQFNDNGSGSVEGFVQQMQFNFSAARRYVLA